MWYNEGKLGTGYIVSSQSCYYPALVGGHLYQAGVFSFMCKLLFGLFLWSYLE